MDYRYEFRQADCWYRETCGLYLGDKCNASCLRYMEMDFLMQTSGIPKQRQYANPLIPDERDMQAFLRLGEIRQDMLEFTQSGASLYLYSQNFGNGKTTWAIKLMQRYFDLIWAGNGFRWRGIFLHVPSFLTKIKENFDRKDIRFQEIRAKLSEVDLVIWDDIASVKLSDFDHTNLLTYIDQRSLNSYSNIYTGNLEGDELRDALGNRLHSRVWNDSVQIKLVGTDRRGSRW